MRGIGTRKWLGDFKDLENDVLKQAAIPDANITELLSELNRHKGGLVQQELDRLDFELKNLSRSIINKKSEIQRKTDAATYIKWKGYIDACSLDFKIMYSNEANDLFDHLFKKDCMFERITLKMAGSVATVISNVCVPFVEDRLAQMMKQDFLIPDGEDDLINGFLDSTISSKANDSGFSSSVDENVKPVEMEGSKNITKKRKLLEFDVVDEIGVVDDDLIMIKLCAKKHKRPTYEVIDEIGNVDITMSQLNDTAV